MTTPDSLTPVDVATRLYAAFASHDRPALAALLHPDFTGRVSEGMPFGLGGSVHGPEQMLRDVWGGASKYYETAPHPDEYVAAGENRVIVLGYYRGRCRTTGRHYAAAFAHDITVRDGKIASLTQITDTKPWHDALAAC
ncbi:nuclear transport factor 2 family protein [Mycolicibacterium mucogenicum]|uniref:nuclear transport factor 2 family protein n=1 Tax=Mycolicibacterium mucogenicum TaxID=56689 RepID=UPI00226A4B63|nr:nuclear transport factor 2 family protein [Mycolicibacterium mucogenicum]MCX8563883.1 nuclear transport factor 2 family protein [Mycolicibacterium mucogenicum]